MQLWYNHYFSFSREGKAADFYFLLLELSDVWQVRSDNYLNCFKTGESYVYQVTKLNIHTRSTWEMIFFKKNRTQEVRVRITVPEK